MSLRAVPDDELVALAQTGDRSAFGELAQRHASAVRVLLRRMGAQLALADDLAQTTFLIAMERIGSFRNDGPFGAWLNRIAARLCIKRWHADGRLELIGNVTGEEQFHPVAIMSFEDMDLDNALQTLSQAERICVSLCHGAGLTHSEIATELALPLGTVKSHVKRGLDKLRTLLAPEYSSRKCTHG